MDCPECGSMMTGPYMFGEYGCQECGYIALEEQESESNQGEN